MPSSSILTALRVWCLSAVVVFLTLLPSLSHALIPVPRIKPQAPNASQFLSDKDAKRFRLALRHAKRGEWSNVRGDIRKLDDPVAKDVMRWIVASRKSLKSFAASSLKKITPSEPITLFGKAARIIPRPKPCCRICANLRKP